MITARDPVAPTDPRRPMTVRWGPIVPPPWADAPSAPCACAPGLDATPRRGEGIPARAWEATAAADWALRTLSR